MLSFIHELRLIDPQIKSLIYNNKTYSYTEILDTCTNLLFYKKPSTCLRKLLKITSKHTARFYTSLDQSDKTKAITDMIHHSIRITGLYNKIFYKVIANEKKKSGLLFVPLHNGITSFYSENKCVIIQILLIRIDNRMKSKEEDESVCDFLVQVKEYSFYNDIIQCIKEHLKVQYLKIFSGTESNIAEKLDLIISFLRTEQNYKCIAFIQPEIEVYILQHVFGNVFKDKGKWDLCVFSDRDKLNQLLVLYEKAQMTDCIIMNLDHWLEHMASIIPEGRMLHVFDNILLSYQNISDLLHIRIKEHGDKKICDLFYRNDRTLIETLNKYIHEYMLNNKDPEIGVTEEEIYIERLTLNTLSELFSHISSKSEFVTLFNLYLTKRLLSHKTSIENEKNLISLFKDKSTNAIFYRSRMIIKEYQDSYDYKGNRVYILDKYKWNDNVRCNFMVNDALSDLESEFIEEMKKINKVNYKIKNHEKVNINDEFNISNNDLNNEHLKVSKNDLNSEHLKVSKNDLNNEHLKINNFKNGNDMNNENLKINDYDSNHEHLKVNNSNDLNNEHLKVSDINNNYENLKVSKNNLNHKHLKVSNNDSNHENLKVSDYENLKVSNIDNKSNSIICMNYNVDHFKTLDSLFKSRNIKYEDLTWRHDLSSCEIEIDSFSFIISVIQFELISLLIQSPYPITSIEHRFNHFPNLTNHITPLIRNFIILKTQTHYIYNTVTKALETNLIPHSIDQTLDHSVKQSNAIENIYITDAMIMRILKRVKNMEKSELIKSVGSGVGVDEKMVEERIWNLGEKGFVEEEKDWIKYVA